MTKMEKIGELMVKENEAREGYRKTGDPSLLKMLMDCLREREQILFKHLPVQQIEKHSADK